MARQAWLSLLLLAVVVGLAHGVTRTTQERSLTQVPWRVTFLSAIYHYEDDTTVFSYSLATGSQNLGFFMIQPTDCPHPGNLDAFFGSNWVDNTLSAESHTHQFGYTWNLGQELGTTQVYNLTFSGNVRAGPANYIVEGNFIYAIGTTMGPSCSGANLQVPCAKPSDATVQCNSTQLATPNPNQYPDFFGQIRENGRCAGDYTLLRIFRVPVAGFSGGFAQCVQTLIVQDTAAPVFSTSDSTIVIECGQQIPGVVTPTVRDNCDNSAIAINFCEERTNGTCSPDYFITRTWTATDDCGNSACVTQTIVIADQTPPVLHNVPPSIDLNCTDTIPAMANVTATDNCCLASLTSSDTEYPGDCLNASVRVREWIATDCCGHVTRAIQEIRLNDVTMPTLTVVSGSVANTTVECSAIPPPATVISSDNCALPLVNFTEIRHNSSVCIFQYLIQRTWSACDNCGNCASLTQFLQVVDRTRPNFTSPMPSNITVECGHVPSALSMSASDNCGLREILFAEVRVNTSCVNEYLLIRTWTAVDFCNNSRSVVQRITVIDTIGAILVPPPAVGPFECAADLPSLNATLALVQELRNGNESSSCFSHTPIMATETIIPGSCPNSFTSHRVFTTQDCAGNMASVHLDIVVRDTIPPTLVGVPADTRMSCDDVIGPPDVTAWDNCQCPLATGLMCIPVSYNQTRINGRCTGDYTLIRTWTAVDACGNVATARQTITVFDTVAPVFTSPILPLNGTCTSIPVALTPSASDNCGPVTVNYTQSRNNGSCGNDFGLVRLWLACDDCGNCRTAPQPISVHDITPPNITGVPPNMNVTCNAIPPPADVCASDNCPNVTLVFSETRSLVPCNSVTKVFEIIVRTWTATDMCGNHATASQTLYVSNPFPPVLPPHADLNESCTNVTLPPAPTATASCNQSVMVTTSVTRLNTSCAGEFTLLVSHEAIDACGNIAWQNYSIFVHDSTPPFIVTPQNMSNECVMPPPIPITGGDLCSGMIIPPANMTNITVLCPNAFVTQVNQTVLDGCGNAVSAISYITVFDNVPPVFDQPAPPNMTVNCSAPPAVTMTATDNCGGPVSITFTERNLTVICSHSYTLERIWVATDQCGNSRTLVQIIIVQDLLAPTLTGVPSAATYECVAPPPADVCVADNCPGVSLEFVETRINGSCAFNYVLNRTWTAIDDCGRRTSQTQLVTVHDVVPPVFQAPPPPAPMTVNCTLPSLVPPQATDDCGIAIVTPHHSRINGSCPFEYTFLVAWRAMDQCGNVAWYNFTIFVIDRTPPVITSWSPAPPVNGSVVCNNLTAAPMPSGVGLCGPAVATRLPDVRTNGSCAPLFTILRRWRLVDECNNAIVVSQLLTGVYAGPPSLAHVPGDVTISCEFAPLAASNLVTAHDSCGNPLPVNHTDRRINGNCTDNYDIERTYYAIDLCGVRVQAIQLIHVRDTTPPTLTLPPPGFFNNICINQSIGNASAHDNCDPHPTISVRRVESPGSCLYVHNTTYIFTAVDRCGNRISMSQTLHYTFSVGPSFSNLPPSLLTLPCTTPLPPTNVSALDACGQLVPVVMSTRRINGTCPGDFTILRIWNATDICGRSISYVQRIVFFDNVPPTLIGVPASTSAQCGFLPPIPNNVTAVDNCSPPVVITVDVVDVPGATCCNYIEMRIWTAIDACGNLARAVQNITVSQTVSPIIVPPPPILCFPCQNLTSGIVPPNSTGENSAVAFLPPGLVGMCVNGSIVAADRCTLPGATAPTGVNLVFNGQQHFLTFSSVQIIMNTGVDGNALIQGNLTEGSTVYALEMILELKETLSQLNGYQPPRTLQPSCYDMGTHNPDLVDPSTWTYFAAFQTATLTGPGVSLTFTPSPRFLAQFGMGANGYDGSYGAEIFTEYINQGRTFAANFSFVVRQEGSDCVLNTAEFPQLLCNQTTPPIIVFQNQTAGPCPGNFTIVRQFCVNDTNTGQLVCAPQVIEVCDVIPPIIFAPADIHINCTTPIPTPTIVVVDNCDPHPNFTVITTRINGTCPFDYVLENLVIATDWCGNVNRTTFLVFVSDVVAPTLHGIPTGQIIAQCDNIPPAANVTATDNCGINLASLVYSETRTNLSCPFSYILTRRYSVADLCGNVATGAYTVLVQDTTPPVLHNIPSGGELECLHDLPTFDVTATDNCDRHPIVSVQHTRINTSCPNVFTLRFTWSAVDSCGNMALPQSAEYSFIDTVPPSFTSPLPANATVECDNIPPAANMTASDNCGPASVSFMTFNTTTPGSCIYHIFRVWTATDCVGHSISYTQMLTVVDNVPPQISPIAPTASGNCTFVPPPPSVCATDNCPGVSIRFVENRVPTSSLPNCPDYDVIRNWTAIDLCGNTNNVSQVVHVRDVVPPTCPSIPPTDVSCELDTGRPPAAPVCHDDCSTPTYTPFFFVTNGSCANARVRHYNWHVCDSCLNCVWVNTTVTVFDHTAPIISPIPANRTIPCLESFIVPNLTATDNCGALLPVTATQTFINGSCPNLGVIMIVYRAVDACGNQAIPVVQMITITDTIPPVWTSPLPPNTTMQCNNVTAAPVLTAHDNCGFVNITFRETNTTLNTCRSVILRMWTATDCSGNSISYTQSILVEDTIAPVLSGNFSHIEASCHSALVPPTVCGTDNCPGLRLNFSEVRVPLSNLPQCARFQLNRTWTLIDRCGNMDTRTQTVRVFDNVPPTCSLPAHTPNISCDLLNTLSVPGPSCVDDCSNVTVTPLRGSLPGSCVSQQTLTFSWLVCDACMNCITVNTSVFVYDNVPPSFVNPPANMTVPCDAVPAAMNLTATDNCALRGVVFSETSTRVLGACQNYTITRRWIATDECGNVAVWVQVLQVIDVYPLVWNQPLPTDMVINCTASPIPPVLTVSSRCHNGTVVFGSVSMGSLSTCNRVMRWTWNASDVCGNFLTHSILVRVVDLIAPTMSPVAPSITEQCNNLTQPPDVCCFDNCPGVSLIFTETHLPGSCPSEYRLLRNWTCVDTCGNAFTQTQMVNVVDNFSPSFNQNIPSHLFFECHMGALPNITSASNVCTNVTVSEHDTRIQYGCPANFTLIREFTGVDECGRIITFNETVDVRDTIPPVSNSTLFCFIANTYADRLIIPNATAIGNLFPASDSCSSVNITLVSCTSDQDTIMGAVPTVPGFTDQCNYIPSTDTLNISGIIDTRNASGRLYVVTARVCDACGHCILVTADIFVPLNSSSVTIRGFPISFEQCVPFIITCPQECACQTVNHYCNASSSNYASWALQYYNMVNNGNGTTTFSYRLAGGSAPRPNRVVLGLDLTLFEVTAVYPDVDWHVGTPRSGTPPGSFISGLYWDHTDSIVSQWYNVTLRGTFSSLVNNIPVQLGGLMAAQDSAPTPCTGIEFTRGPHSPPAYTGGNAAAISGIVDIAGVRFGSDRNMDYPLSDVVVALVLRSSHALAAFTLTDQNGTYSFHGISNAALYQVQLWRSGLFELTQERSPGWFLRVGQYEMFQQDPVLGGPHNLTSPNFALLINDQAVPFYNRPTVSGAFEGDSKPMLYWYYQDLRVGKPDVYDLAAIDARADALIGCATSFTGADDLESNLRAAAMNVAAGRGFFEPYNLVQEWYLAFAAHVYCNNISNSVDRAFALRFVRAINNANDMTSA